MIFQRLEEGERRTEDFDKRFIAERLIFLSKLSPVIMTNVKNASGCFRS